MKHVRDSPGAVPYCLLHYPTYGYGVEASASDAGIHVALSGGATVGDEGRPATEVLRERSERPCNVSLP